MGMQPLIDADILRYEVGFAAEYGWQSTNENGEKEIPPFDYVAEMLDNRIANICAEVWATEEPILFLTGKGNFRDSIAKRKGYKENRKSSKKPWHFNNITAYMLGMYNTIVSEGMEADDMLSIEQMSRIKLKDTIICSRDKDLKITPGLHFTWELGRQPSWGPKMVTDIGEINLKGTKLTGNGKKFFYSQCLMGDTTDNILGLPKCGPVKAYKTLEGKESEIELFNAVLEEYRKVYGDNAEEELLEQGRLLWMVRELDSKGKPVMWEFPKNECEKTD